MNVQGAVSKLRFVMADLIRHLVLNADRQYSMRSPERARDDMIVSFDIPSC